MNNDEAIVELKSTVENMPVHLKRQFLNLLRQYSKDDFRVSGVIELIQ